MKYLHYIHEITCTMWIKTTSLPTYYIVGTNLCYCITPYYQDPVKQRLVFDLHLARERLKMAQLQCLCWLKHTNTQSVLHIYGYICFVGYSIVLYKTRQHEHRILCLRFVHGSLLRTKLPAANDIWYFSDLNYAYYYATKRVKQQCIL